MEKYWYVLKMGWQDAIEDRAEFFISFLGWLVRLGISIFLFAAVFQQKSEIGGFNLQNTITYFIVIQILTTLVFSRVGFAIATDIQKGDLSNYLIKPISYLLFQALRQFSRNLMQIFFGLIFFIVLLSIVDLAFLANFKLNSLLLGIVSMIIGYSININLVMIIGLSAFWISNSARLLFMFYAILSIFSGLMIPLNFFPETAQNILMKSPFPYIFYVPAQILMGNIKLEIYTSLITTSLIYSLALSTITYLLYKTGIKKYEAFGR